MSNSTCCLSGLADELLFYYPIPRPAAYFITVLECLLLSLPLPMLTVDVLHCCGESMHRARLFRAVLGMWAVFLALLASASFIGVLSYIAPHSRYVRGPLYPLLLLPLVGILLLNLAGFIRRRSQFSHKAFFSLLIAILPMAATLPVQRAPSPFPTLT